MTDKEKNLMLRLLEISMKLRHVYGIIGSADELENLVKEYERDNKTRN